MEITGEERILLYMLNFGSLDDVYECDSGVTQKGISVNTRIQRKHISRYLDKLMENGLLEENVRHVTGGKQKMKCYSLTPQGLTKARELEERIGKIIVKVQMGQDVKDMRIADIDGATSVHLRFSDIVCQALENGDVLCMEVLENMEEQNRRMMDEKTMKTEVYRQALAVAWRSGILTSSEKHLIDALKTHLGVSDEDHRALENVILDSVPDISTTQADIYDEIMNLLDGQPTEREEMILEMLRERVERPKPKN